MLTQNILNQWAYLSVVTEDQGLRLQIQAVLEQSALKHDIASEIIVSAYEQRLLVVMIKKAWIHEVLGL